MIAVNQEQLDKVNQILQCLDETLKKPPEDNRRRAPRINIRTPMTITLLTLGSLSSVETFSRNISQSGLGFVSRRMFRPEERIVISLRIPNLPAKLILARITFGRYVQNGLYEAGAEFLECTPDPQGTAKIPRYWISGTKPIKAIPPGTQAREQAAASAASAEVESA